MQKLFILQALRVLYVRTLVHMVCIYAIILFLPYSTQRGSINRIDNTCDPFMQLFVGKGVKSQAF